MLFVSQKKVLILQIEQELFDRNKPHFIEFETVAKSLPNSTRSARKYFILSKFLFIHQILVAKV